MQMQNGRFLLLLLYFALALGFVFVVPIFEAPDEHHHYYTIRHMADEREFPIAQESLARQEAAQPPLYYLVGAILVSPISVEVDWQPWFNPYVRLGDFNAPQNQNAFVHGLEPTGHTQAVRLLRLYSVLLGAGTVWLMGAIARLLWDEQAGLLAMGLTAVWPQFLFLHSSVTNDTQIIFLCTLALWWLLRMVSKKPPDGLGPYFVLALMIVLAVWTKMTGLGLLVLAVFILALKQIQTQKWSLPPFVALVVPTVLLTIPLFWRNWTLYGDVTAVSAFVELAGGDRAWSLLQLFAELDRVWVSSFAVFGWMNLPAPDWVVWLWTGVVVAGLLGWVLSLVRDWRSGALLPNFEMLQDRRLLPLLLFASWFGAVFLAWVQFMMQTSADQGRLLFPALASLVLLIVGGWRVVGKWAWGLVALGGITAVYTLVVTLPQAYFSWPIYTEPINPTTMGEFYLSERIKVVDVIPLQTTVEAGDIAWFDVYWQKESGVEVSEGVTAVYTLLGYQQDPLGKVHHLFRTPSSLWQDSEFIAERIGIPVDSSANVPTVATLYVTLLEHEPVVAMSNVKIIGDWVDSVTPLAYVGDGIQISGVDISNRQPQPNETVIITVTWVIETDILQDYVTFLHMGDPAQAPLAQADGLARQGNYPPSQWQTGERFTDTYYLTIPAELPAGNYPVQMGLYHPQTGVRLPITKEAGEPFAHQAYSLGEFTVVRP